MDQKHNVKLHVRLTEAQERPLVGCLPAMGGSGIHACVMNPGGRSLRLEEVRRGRAGFCHLERLADDNWRPKLTPQVKHITHPLQENRTRINDEEGYLSVLRMLQSPRPWGERNGHKVRDDVSGGVHLRGKVRSINGSKMLRPEFVSKSSPVGLSSSTVRPHRARYCLLPTPELLLRDRQRTGSDSSSHGSHQDRVVHRASLLAPQKKSCFTLTHRSCDNGLVQVIKPPVTPIDLNCQQVEQQEDLPCTKSFSRSREVPHTPTVLSRLERILYPECQQISKHRITTCSEQPSAGSAVPDISTLLADLGVDVNLTTEDFEASAKTVEVWSLQQSSQGNWVCSEWEASQQRMSRSLEVPFLFPQSVRLGKIPLPRSYNMQDPLDVHVFLEHLPDAFPTLTIKCELWLRTSPLTNYTLAL